MTAKICDDGTIRNSCITKSRSGHYTVTVRELRDNGERAYWATAYKVGKLPDLRAARAALADYHHQQGA